MVYYTYVKYMVNVLVRTFISLKEYKRLSYVLRILILSNLNLKRREIVRSANKISSKALRN